MRKETERTKELIEQGKPAYQIIEILIHEDYFPDSEQSRALLLPAVNELINQMNQPEESPQEKVLRVRIWGVCLDPFNEKTKVGSQIYRFIGNEEVSTAEKEIMGDWLHYSKPLAAPLELHFRFERLDIGKELNYMFTREFIDSAELPDERLRDIIRQAVQ